MKNNLLALLFILPFLMLSCDKEGVQEIEYEGIYTIVNNSDYDFVIEGLALSDTIIVVPYMTNIEFFDKGSEAYGKPWEGADDTVKIIFEDQKQLVFSALGNESNSIANENGWEAVRLTKYSERFTYRIANKDYQLAE